MLLCLAAYKTRIKITFTPLSRVHNTRLRAGFLFTSWAIASYGYLGGFSEALSCLRKTDRSMLSSLLKMQIGNLFRLLSAAYHKWTAWILWALSCLRWKMGDIAKLKFKTYGKGARGWGAGREATPYYPLRFLLPCRLALLSNLKITWAIRTVIISTSCRRNELT